MRSAWREIIPVLVLVLGISLLHYLPWVQRIRLQPADRTFLAIHNSRSDYPVYLDYIKQGLQGEWTVRNSYAIEPHGGTYFYWIFLFFGQAGRVLGATDAQVVYHASTVVTGIIWFAVLYVLSRFMFGERWQRLSAMALFLYGASWPLFTRNGSGWLVSWYMTWWTELDPIHRVFFLPHHVLGHSLVVGMSLLILLAVASRSPRFLLLAIPPGLLAGFIHPPSLIIVLMVLPPYVLLRRRFRLLPFVGVFCLTTVLSLLFIQRELQRFPIEGWYESLSFALPLREYLLALGPVLPLSLLGLLRLRKRPELWLFVLWAGLSIAAVDISRRLLDVPWPILRMIPISNVRFLQHAVWIPLGVLTIAGLDLVRHRCGRAAAVGAGLLLGAVTLIGYPSAYASYTASLPTVNDFDAPRREWGEALAALSGLPPGRVFSMQFTGYYIPGLGGRGVYLGREYITRQHETKAINAYRFYQGMESCEAFRLLRDHGFTGVFYGFDEQTAGDAVTRYRFLFPWKRFNTTVIYVVEPTSGC